MNYRRIHNLLIERARSRELTSDFERHHVVPRSIGGTNESSNIVRLTYREHFLVHWLLVKFTDGDVRRKMQCALHQMAFRNRGNRIVAAWQYEVSRKAKKAAQIGRPSGKSGKKSSPETRAKLSEARRGEKNHFFGRHHSAETKAKLSAANRGRKPTPEEVARYRAATLGKPNPFLGKHHSPEALAKMRGRKWSEEARARIRGKGGPMARKRLPKTASL